MAEYLITEFGAEPGAEQSQAGAMQRVIDATSAEGGGRVVVPAGDPFVIGTLDLRAGVDLHLEKGAALLGSPHRSDYREEEVAGEYGAGRSGFLIRADGAEGISITGEGVIDQRGRSFSDGFATDDGPYALRWKSWRPRMLGLYRCAGVRLRGVTLRDPANWCVHLLGCEDVEIEDLTIRTPLDGPNCDGICLDHCTNARVVDCDIESGDDSIVIKTTQEGRRLGFDGTRDVEVSGCRLMSTSSAIKIGSESRSDFERLRFSGCVVRSSARGLGIQLRDGGDVRDVVFSDIEIETRLFHDQWWGKAEPIYVSAVPRDAGGEVGRIDGVRFERIRARSEGGVFLDADEPGHLDGVTLSDVRLTLDKWTKWPGGFHDRRPTRGGEQTGLTRHPTSAIWVRHASGIRLADVAVAWGADPPEYFRHGLETDRSSEVIESGLEISSANPAKYSARLVH